ncbi:hypothetical protein M0Q39_05665 [Patescibacteria group bacterium]|nr:hypothetical protein [Patescibacteria group bacterium]
MSKKNEEILDTIKEYLEESYNQTETAIIPKKDNLTFGNTIKKIDHVKVFYIDMRKSRKILTDANDFWSIKIHKSFLLAVIYSIEKRGGHLRSFNGDGVLAFFIGDNAASRAVRAALDIKGFVLEINKILIKNDKKKIDFGIGIAQGSMKVAKTGKGGDDQTKQDLIWIGLPLYVALELSELGKFPENIWISPHVRSSIGKEKHLNVLYDDKTGKSIWVKHNKKLKSVGDYDVRSTNYYGII